jgi:cytidylate kinase
LADNKPKRVVVAIDGPAGAGKSTIAKRLAERLGFTYIDTGAMYRAVALWAVRQGVDFADPHRVEQLALASEIDLAPGRIRLNREDVTESIRTPEVSSGASKIAVIPGVRRAMVAKQREIGERVSVVMEGRDIGTVVFPHAAVKIFLDAAPEVRGLRRFDQLGQLGPSPTVQPEEVIRDLRARDARDRNRADSPLKPASDAILLDSTHMTLEEAVREAEAIVSSKLSLSVQEP